MKSEDVLKALGSLAQETRLAVYRLLVKQGPEGLSAGALAEKLRVPASSLSFHLQQLRHAGLISQHRHSRQLIYATNFSLMNELVRYLTENCCGGASCAPVCEVSSPARATRNARTR